MYMSSNTRVSFSSMGVTHTHCMAPQCSLEHTNKYLSTHTRTQIHTHKQGLEPRSSRGRFRQRVLTSRGESTHKAAESQALGPQPPPSPSFLCPPSLPSPCVAFHVPMMSTVTTQHLFFESAPQAQ